MRKYLALRSPFITNAPINMLPSSGLDMYTGGIILTTIQIPAIRLTTDQDGMAVVDKYVASQISGTYLITAYLVSDPSVKDTVNLNVQVPALVNFRDLIFLPRGEEPYTLAQATQAAVNNHPDNDYCTPAMGDSLFLKKLYLSVTTHRRSMPWSP